jgi:tRNA C32,U32 (ribose-2'-O)-methylase TrmJ
MQDVDWTKPAAVIFGNELDGVSKGALDAADVKVVIPMSGFSQSLNISVAAAVVLHEARQHRMRSQGFHGTLLAKEQRLLAAVMLLRAQVRMLAAVWAIASCTPISRFLRTRHTTLQNWAKNGLIGPVVL